MPSTRNTSLSAPWTQPAFVGKRYLEDNQAGFNTLPGENPNQVLTYARRRAYGEITKCAPALLNLNIGGYTGPYKGLFNVTIWNDGKLTEPAAVMARNKAYARFRDRAVGENSAVGVFAAERREAYGMVYRRVTGLYRAYKHLRRGEFRQFLRELSVNPKRKHRSWVRSAANEASGLWLEYWFGWSPTITDIYNTVEVLTQDLPAGRYYGSAKARLAYYNKLVYQSNPTGNFEEIDQTAVYRAQMGATIKLVNPDLFLLNQLGLINPASVAWEIVPFSFVIDWFTQFGSSLNAMSDWVGLEVRDPYQTYTLKATKHNFRKRVASYPMDFTVEYLPEFRAQRLKGLYRPTPVYPVIGNFGKSKTRAATAVSLLTQLFLSGK